MNSLIIIVITLFFSAFFSGLEIAFLTANKLKLELDKKQGSFSSGIISIFYKNPQKYISTMLVGNNIALVIYSIVMANVLEPVIRTFTHHDSAILILQTLLSTLLILMIAEFLPKVLFRLNPNGALNFLALPVFFFYVIFYPVTKTIVWLSRFFLKIFFRVKFNTENDPVLFTKIDLDQLVNEVQSSKEENEDVEHDIKIFQNALDFSNVKLRDCTIPRTEIYAINADESIEMLKQKFVESGFSKIMIYKDSIDNIIGFVHSIDIFKNPKQIRNIIRNVLIVPETMPANKLLTKFIKENKSVAVVVDEFGGTAGIVTIEDIMEEIFGEIEDEHDNNEFVAKKISDTEFILSGRLEIDYLNEKFNLNLPENNEYNTIAGLILFHHNNIPTINDQIEINNLHFNIIKASNTRIELVRMKIINHV